jgi:hypothetical protein
VSLQNPVQGATLLEVPMLIDSGADVTLVPSELLPKLSLSTDPGFSSELESFDGSRTIAQSVQLDLYFLGKRFRGRFLLINQEFGILGRNILNHFSLTLNGPHLIWHQEDENATQT